MEDDSSVEESKTVDGDQRISEESVEVDNKVGVEPPLGLQEREVIPASWPTRSASKVIENCWVLDKEGYKMGWIL